MKKAILLFISIFLIFCLVISCDHSKPSVVDFKEESFKDTFNLKHGKVYENDSLFIGNPTWIRFHSDSFLIVQDMGTSKLIKIIDLKRNKIQEVIPQGRGPGEMIVAWGIQVMGKDLYVFCGQLRKVIVLTPDANRDFRITKEFSLDERETTKFCPLKSDIMVCLSDFGQDKRLTFLNNNGKILKKYGNYPPIIEGNNVKVDNNIFQSYIESAPNGEKFVLACSRTDIIEIYDTEKGLTKRFQGPIGIQLSIKNRNMGVGTMIDFQPSYLTFGRGDANEDEFWFGYVGFNTKSKERPSTSDVSPKRIFCFDWLGNPLRKIVFDNPFVAFDVDWSGKELYTIEWVDKYPKVVSYSLLNILK
jgi:hypothetical protein